MWESIPRPVVVSARRFRSGGVMVPGVRTRMRVASLYEIECFEDSEGVTYLDEDAYPIRRGMVVLRRPGQRCSSVPPYACFTVRMLLDADNPYIAALPRVLLPEPADACLAECALLCDAFVSPFEGRDLLLAARTLSFLHTLYAQARRVEAHEAGATPYQRVVADAVAFMQAHYREQIALSDLARRVSLSPNYFHRLFKQALHITPFDYLSALRLEAAKELLRVSDLSMMEISERCGFSTPSYFHYVFRKTTGVTPRAFRQQNLS